MTTDRITFRLGELAQPLAKACQTTGERPSDVVRRAVAEYLHVATPTLRGQVANLRQYQSQRRKRRTG